VKLHKSEVQSISNVEKGHLQKFLTVEAKKTTQLKCTSLKLRNILKCLIENYQL
jgi:hypothetical protein